MVSIARLERAYKRAMRLRFDNYSKIVIMSDCHRGTGDWGDNFLSNQNLFFGALTYYYQNNYTYLELGDGDELWENRNLKQIIGVHSNAFWLMSRFYREGRLYMLYGNHDKQKAKKKFCTCNIENYYCENLKETCDLFPGLTFPESILLENIENGKKIFLVHGHQGDIINDYLWKLGRFLVRYVWRPLELIGIKDPTSASKNEKRRKKAEKRMISWAKRHQEPLIAGHTHRTYFAKEDTIPYYNDGSCVHPRCITALEIENNQISLIKWAVLTKEDRTMYVGREVLEGPRQLWEEENTWIDEYLDFTSSIDKINKKRYTN